MQKKWGKKMLLILFGKFLAVKRILSFILNHDKGKIWYYRVSVDSPQNSPRKGVPFSIENKTGVPEYNTHFAGLFNDIHI